MRVIGKPISRLLKDNGQSATNHSTLDEGACLWQWMTKTTKTFFSTIRVLPWLCLFFSILDLLFEVKLRDMFILKLNHLVIVSACLIFATPLFKKKSQKKLKQEIKILQRQIKLSNLTSTLKKNAIKQITSMYSVSIWIRNVS